MKGRWPWMTVNCYKFEFSWNFARFRIFGRQQRLNEWRQTHTVSDRIVAHWMYFSSMYRFRWYCYAFLRYGLQLHYTALCGFVSDGLAFLFMLTVCERLWKTILGGFPRESLLDISSINQSIKRLLGGLSSRSAASSIGDSQLMSSMWSGKDFLNKMYPEEATKCGQWFYYSLATSMTSVRSNLEYWHAELPMF